MQPTPDKQTQVDAALERLKPFDKEAHFIKATGTTEQPGGTIHEVGKGRDGEMGSYGYNNGTLAFVDENGDYWVGRNDDAAVRALQEAGYNNRGVYVPHSNDGGGWMREHFDSPREQAAESKRIKAQVDAALERLKPFDKEAHFIKATGTTEQPGGTIHEVGKGRDGEMGSYGYNNGTLAFVDENGDYWVGRNDDAAVRALQEAGYNNRGVYVPHSNDGGGWMREHFDNRNK